VSILRAGSLAWAVLGTGLSEVSRSYWAGVKKARVLLYVSWSCNEGGVGIVLREAGLQCCTGSSRPVTEWCC
jgi:hypothetical protein